MKVRELCDEDGMLKEMREFKTPFIFPKPNGGIKAVSILFFPDAALNISNNKQYGKKGIRTGLEYC